jgi:uncharacterized membrane protein
MNGIRSLLGNLHLAAGGIALLAFWFPLFTRKGGRFHRTAGWVFVAAMSAILTSAATMTVQRIIAGNRDFALFLGFLWFYHHFESMIVAGMAAHIASFAFGSTRLWPNLYAGQPWWLMLLTWVAPFPLVFGAIALLKRHYRRRFAPGKYAPCASPFHRGRQSPMARNLNLQCQPSRGPSRCSKP